MSYDRGEVVQFRCHSFDSSSQLVYQVLTPVVSVPFQLGPQSLQEHVDLGVMMSYVESRVSRH